MANMFSPDREPSAGELKSRDDGQADSFLVVSDLVVSYGRTEAVKGVSFSVGAGECVTLLGPSGCGKSTTLRAIAGLERPVSGSITLDGRPVFSPTDGIFVPPEKRRLSMVFQSYAIWPHMTVLDNVIYGVAKRGKSSQDIRAIGMRALEVVQMAEYANRNASKLSGGQQQRVALARSIAPSPKAILFDEPLSNLDLGLRKAMREELEVIRNELKITAVYVTHDQEEALAMSDKIVVMNNGIIEQTSSPIELHTKPRSWFVADFMGASNMIEGDLTFDREGEATLRTRAGTLLRLGDVGGERDSSVGHGVIAIRPFHFRLGLEWPQGDVNVWTGHVSRRSFAGDLTDYEIKCADGVFRVQRPSTEHFEPGQEIVLWVNMENCVPVGM